MFYRKNNSLDVYIGTIDNKNSSFIDHVLQHFQIRSRERKKNIR